MRVWNKRTGHLKPRKVVDIEVPTVTPTKPPLRAPTLNRLALIVDTGGAFQEEDNEAITLDESNRRAQTEGDLKESQK